MKTLTFIIIAALCGTATQVVTTKLHNAVGIPPMPAKDPEPPPGQLEMIQQMSQEQEQAIINYEVCAAAFRRVAEITAGSLFEFEQPRTYQIMLEEKCGKEPK
jgi:hypothetical protein